MATISAAKNGIAAAKDSTIDLSALHLGTISLDSLLSALLTLVICLIAIRLVITVLRRVLAKTPLDDRIQKYISNAVRCALWIVAILITADQMGISINSLIALLSVLTLAISLAVQNALSNVAGGLVILISKPFRPGDFIESADGSGTVKEINLTYTHLDTPDGLRISIPNSNLSAGKVINYTTLGCRRVDHTITASYNAPVDTVRQACLDAVSKTPSVLSDPAPVAYVSAYKESSIEYVVRCWCKPADYWDVYFALLQEIKASFDESGVEMTYNHLNVHIVEK